MAILQRKGYKGNPRLKRAGESIDCTREQFIEYIKCLNDPVYFIRNYMKIINVDKGLMNFEMYGWQEEMVGTVLNNRFTIAKIARQSGKSSIVTGIILWSILFQEEYSIAMLAHKEAQAKELLARIKMAYEHLPLWMQQGIKNWSKTHIELENGSEVMASATSSSAIRGNSVNMVYLDEFAIVEKNIQEDFFASVYPTISSGKSTKIVITSTPKGMDKFYEIWQKAEKGKNDYKIVDIPWYANPGRDEKFKQETIKNTSLHTWRAEFECQFLGSNLTLIDGEYLAKMETDDPISMSDDGSLHVFKEPVKGHTYVLTADVARGIGGDYSAFTVVDTTDEIAEVVATFYNNSIRPVMFPQVIYRMAMHYNQAYLLIETNDLGEDVADSLYWDLEYENILCVVKQKRTKTPRVSLAGMMERQAAFGLKMTSPVKKVGCATLKTIVEKDRLIIHDNRIKQELASFVEKNDSFKAEPGKHDDLAMSLVLFAWLTRQEIYKDLCAKQFQRSLQDENAEDIRKSTIGTVFVDNGVDNFWEDFEEDEMAALAADDAEIVDDFIRRYTK